VAQRNYALKDYDTKAELAYKLLESCRVCPRRCGVNRLNDERGFCEMGRDFMISSYGPHFGEEPELVGKGGSGTIFLTGCNLKCMFCQNYTISHLKDGEVVAKEKFVDIMFTLEDTGCHNINFVTPTHFGPQILEAIITARKRGLKVPFVYNCGGYESLEMLKLFDGLIEIYMPDFKYSDSKVAEELANAPDYFEICKAAIKEMHRQVGDLVVDSGIAVKGLLVRHLVMPYGLAGTEEIMRFLAEEISKDAYVNIMDQYYPAYQAKTHPKLNRRITTTEYDKAVTVARSHGLHRGFYSEI